MTAGPGQGRRVEVSWQDGQVRRSAVVQLDGTPDDDKNGELLRWYLEDYAEAPADPGPALAASAERLLARDGEQLFRQLFSTMDAVGIWERARDRLGEVRVEVDADPGNGPGLAWELLRDPARDAPLALGAGAFVRVHPQAAAHPDLPEPSGDHLRVLLVICRPGGRNDVPFRSVASRLVRGGADQMPGLDLDVLRPATFARLSKVLHEAKAAGRPYHVVHFDGHGDYLDVADLGVPDDAKQQPPSGGGGMGDFSPLRYGIVAGPVRQGQHGYLLFEAPGGTRPAGTVPTGTENVQLVDGPTLGRLLTETGVPVLVLNACRSAYAEARSQPGKPAQGVAGDGPAQDIAGIEPARDVASDGPAPDVPDERAPADRAAGSRASVDDDALTGDVHARIRAYGSLAAEIADAGVPGVVAMRYTVYVVTAAQFVADLYAHLLAGRSLGAAATEARRALAADPTRQIGAVPVSLQDWAVPLVYESTPLELLRPETHAAPVIRLTPSDGGADDRQSQVGGAGPQGVPRPPDAGFFGRDETLLALDRAFDTQRTVLLHAFAGAGKSSTAAEFARWYEATGGLDQPERPESGPGPVLWSSFEHHLTADRVIGQAGDYFAPLIDQVYGKPWTAITDPAERRDVALQVLAQIPVLWVWDNVEPVAGFPAGTPSAWTSDEQEELAGLLRDLAQQTRCKVLLTSRRDEHGWLGNLPARVRLPAMPMRESQQLAVALAERHGRSIAAADWRPLLRFAAGNPLTITVVVGQALRENLTTSDQLAAFEAQLRAGEMAPESGQDAALGRTRSLAASLDYGFARAFTDAERAQLAVLHLFRDTVDVDVLRFMGNPETAEEDAIPVLAGLDRGAGIALLDRAADIGLLSSLGGGYYAIHPALPWYFGTLFAAAHGKPGSGAVLQVGRAYARAVGELGDFYLEEADSGNVAGVIETVRAEESNLLHALDYARTDGLWRAAIGCMQALRVLYDRTGRGGEWARLVANVAPDITDPVTGGPLPGLDEYWGLVTSYRARLARDSRDWRTAVALQEALLAWYRQNVDLKVPPGNLTRSQQFALGNLGAVVADLGEILRRQGDTGCLAYLLEALTIAQQISDRYAEAQRAGNLGNAYQSLEGNMQDLRDLDEAERWFRHSLSLRADSDRAGRASNLSSLAGVALSRYEDGRAAGRPERELLTYLNDALRSLGESLDLTAADDHVARGTREGYLGTVFAYAGDTGQALRHFQRAIGHHEARGAEYQAAEARYNIALALADDGRIGEALQYARAAMENYRRLGLHTGAAAAQTESLIAQLEQLAQ